MRGMSQIALTLAAAAGPVAMGGELDTVHAPVVVSRIPVNAFNGLFRCADGEIRHYGDGGYLSSRDDGLTWSWQDAPTRETRGGRPLAMSPRTGTCLRLSSGNGGTVVFRSTTGPDGQFTGRTISDCRVIMVRPPLFLASRDRALFAGHGDRPARITVFRSDDDGLTWAATQLPAGPAFEVKPPHAGPRWENWCVEPTILEMEDGRLWMIARTSRDRHRQCFSADGGETWSAWEPSRFYGTLTMPTLHRLSDGRILMLWCNTTPLPEIDRSAEKIPESAKNGRWEDVFTNRDACHAAISEDDGRTWRGFRELRLNPLRHRGDVGKLAKRDFSVHQMQALEVRGGKVLVAHGQDDEVRRLLLFDPAWLLEPRRRTVFESGLDDWSTHRYVKGIVGHCAYNRCEGARLVPHPDRPGADAQVLQLRHSPGERLVFSRDGAVWNFPAAKKGVLTVRIKLLSGGGMRLCLLDRWVNPTDPVVRDYAMFALEVPGDGTVGGSSALSPGDWHTVTLEWDDTRAADCRVQVDGKPLANPLPLLHSSLDGISYAHFQALSDVADGQGFLIESVEGGSDASSE